jgi:hypothetical protein
MEQKLWLSLQLYNPYILDEFPYKNCAIRKLFFLLDT